MLKLNVVGSPRIEALCLKNILHLLTSGNYWRLIIKLLASAVNKSLILCWTSAIWELLARFARHNICLLIPCQLQCCQRPTLRYRSAIYLLSAQCTTRCINLSSAWQLKRCPFHLLLLCLLPAVR